MGAREAAFGQLGRAVRQLFHQIRAVAEAAVPATDGFTVSHRGVMESLASGGAQTVPALARARPVARQRIQVLVNDLSAWGLVEALPNPAHRRSALMALTAAGRRRFDAILAAEEEVLSSIPFSLSARRMVAVAEELSQLWQDLETWRHSPPAPSSRRARGRARPVGHAARREGRRRANEPRVGS